MTRASVVINNKLRLETLQWFMLTNVQRDAIELLIWVAEGDIARTCTASSSCPALAELSASTGYIDFLQVRNSAIHILDYKPHAGTNKPIAQLAIYALMLTHRVSGLKLFDST